MKQVLQQATQVLSKQTPVKALYALQQVLAQLQPYFFQQYQSVPPFDEFYQALFAFFTHYQQAEMPKIEVLKYLQISLYNSPFLVGASAPIQKFFDLVNYTISNTSESLRELGYSVCRIFADKLEATTDKITYNCMILLKKQAFQPFLKCCRLMAPTDVLREYAFAFLHMKVREIGYLMLGEQYYQIFDIIMQIRDFVDQIDASVRDAVLLLLADRILENLIYPFVINSLKQGLLADSYSDDPWLVMKHPDAPLYERIGTIPELELQQDSICEPTEMLSAEGVELVEYLLNPQPHPQRRAIRVSAKASFFLLSEVVSAFPDAKLLESLDGPYEGVADELYKQCRIAPGAQALVCQHFSHFFYNTQKCTMSELYALLARVIDPTDPASANGYVRCVTLFPKTYENAKTGSGELIGLVGISALAADVIYLIIADSATPELQSYVEKVQRISDAFYAEREREKEARKARADESVRDVVEQIYARKPAMQGFNRIRSYFEEKWCGDGLDSMREELQRRSEQ